MYNACVFVLVEGNINTYTHTYVHIHRDIHIYVYKEMIQLITNKIYFSVSITTTKEEKEAPESAKYSGRPHFEYSVAKRIRAGIFLAK